MISRKKRSTIFNHEAEVGVKWTAKRGCFSSHSFTLVFARGVVIADQMQRLVFRGLPVNLAQEIEPFSMAVVLLATGDDRSIQRVECGRTV